MPAPCRAPAPVRENEGTTPTRPTREEQPVASKNWIAAGTASVLGIGVIAGGAIGVASAMPLVDSSSAAAVPPLSSSSGEDVKQVGGDVSFEVVPSTPAPTPTTSPAPSASDAPAPEAPAPAPQPVQPAPAPAPAPIQPPTEVDSPDSGYSVPSADDGDDD